MKKSFPIIIALFIFALFAQSASAEAYDIVIVRGDLPVDLIIAQTYAHTKGIPLITVERTGMNQEIGFELYGFRTQGYKNALIVGGDDAIPAAVENDLTGLNFSVTRLWDWSRYGTAARVAVSLWEKSDTVVVSLGDQRGTLLSAAPIAINFKSPLLLVETDKVPDETKKAIIELGASRIILFGNASDRVKHELAALGGLQLTEQKQFEIAKQSTDQNGLFLIGIIIGGLVIFLLSSLSSVGLFGRRMEVPSEIFSENERKILKEIEKAENELKQEDLPSITGFSRVKVARITSELEERDIIEKKKIGKTHVLILKRALK